MSACYAVAAWLLGLGPSGASQRLLALLEALPPLLMEGERVVVLQADTMPLLRVGPRLEVRGVRIPARPTWRRALAERRRLAPVLRDVGASLLHLETLPVPPRLPCPVVLTVHDLRDLGPFARRPRVLFLRTLRASAARADALVAPSEFTAQGLRAAAEPAREVTVVPGVLGAGFTTAPARAEPRFAGAFLHVGHLEPRKGLETLLAAYARALATDPELPQLVFAGGDGGSLRSLRARARALHIAAHVHFLGTVDDTTLRVLYANAGAVLVPSLHEGFGMPALEALAFGKRVAVAQAGALPEVVGSAASVVPAGDEAAWAATLLDLARPEHDAAAAADTRRAQAARFSPHAAASTLLALWRRIAQ